MTTGTIGTLPVGFQPDVNAIGHYKTWSGGDGKYESVGGSVRAKWNSYSMETYTLYNAGSPILLSGLVLSPGPYQGQVITFPFVGGRTIRGRPTSISNLPSAASQNVALQGLLSKVKGHNFDLGVNLGQMGQTVSLLSDNLGKLGRAALALKRGSFAAAARQLGARPRTSQLKSGDVSGRWLELQYGWLPLLSDSFEAAKAFEAISNGPRKTIFRSSHTEDIVSNDLCTSPSNFSAKLRGQLSRRLEYELYEEMTVARQLGLYDPLSIAWELTPWSFVVDWFVPIGTYLDNLNQIPRLKGRWLITDMVKYAKQVPEFVWNLHTDFFTGGSPNLKVSGPTVKVVKWPSPNYSAAKLTRTYSGSPPSVPFPGTKFSGAIHGNRFWNAIALAYQRFR